MPHLVACDLTSKQEDLSQSTSASAKALTPISWSRSTERDSDPEYIINHVTKSCDLHMICQVQNPFSHVTSLARDHYNPRALPEHMIPIHVISPVTSLGQDLRQLSKTKAQEPNLLQPHSATPHVTKSGDHFTSRNQVPHQSSNLRWTATAITLLQ